MAPTLMHQDLAKPFTVEADASNFMLGELQLSNSDSHLHLCAFYSCKLTLAEENHGILDKEMLAIKWPLRNESTSWRRLGPESKFSLTIKTWSI